MHLKALDNAEWHRDNCEIEKTIGDLDGDEEMLHIVAFPWYQRVELRFHGCASQCRPERGANPPSHGHDTNDENSTLKHFVCAEGPAVEHKNAELGNRYSGGRKDGGSIGCLINSEIGPVVRAVAIP